MMNVLNQYHEGNSSGEGDEEHEDDWASLG